jgi:hypothetical protein
MCFVLTITYWNFFVYHAWNFNKVNFLLIEIFILLIMNFQLVFIEIIFQFILSILYDMIVTPQGVMYGVVIL